MHDAATLFRHWRILLVVLLLGVLVVLNFDRINFIRPNPIDRTDYAAVADSFIRSSGFIGQRLGKVTRITHIGRGGSGGIESYNAFSVTGADASGLINMTLTKGGDGTWEVTLAELTTGGTVYEVPISRSSGDKWRLFRWGN